MITEYHAWQLSNKRQFKMADMVIPFGTLQRAGATLHWSRVGGRSCRPLPRIALHSCIVAPTLAAKTSGRINVVQARYNVVRRMWTR